MSAGAQDDLMTLVHEEYGPRYLAGVVYPRMARHVGPDARVVEIGCRPGERGVISKAIIPHSEYLTVDRDPARARACGARCLSVLEQPIHADVILSTCVLHHTPEGEVPRKLANMRAPLLMFSGPNAETHPPYGDHDWHLEIEKLRAWLNALGYLVSWERIGLTEPFCELLIVAKRSA